MSQVYCRFVIAKLFVVAVEVERICFEGAPVRDDGAVLTLSAAHTSESAEK